MVSCRLPRTLDTAPYVILNIRCRAADSLFISWEIAVTLCAGMNQFKRSIRIAGQCFVQRSHGQRDVKVIEGVLCQYVARGCQSCRRSNSRHDSQYILWWIPSLYRNYFQVSVSNFMYIPLLMSFRERPFNYISVPVEPLRNCRQRQGICETVR